MSLIWKNKNDKITLLIIQEHEQFRLKEEKRKQREKKKAEEEAKRAKAGGGKKVKPPPLRMEEEGCIVDKLLCDVRKGFPLRKSNRGTPKKFSGGRAEGKDFRRISALTRFAGAWKSMAGGNRKLSKKQMALPPTNWESAENRGEVLEEALCLPRRKLSGP